VSFVISSLNPLRNFCDYSGNVGGCARLHRRKASWFMEAAALQVEGSMAEFHFEMGQGQG
jgi:hypothetical protein